MSKRIMIDPPQGWRWGFPREYDQSRDGDIREFLRKAGYPEQDLDFALSYMRSWETEEQ